MTNKTQKINCFRQFIKKWYKKNKRSFPWRETKNPYYILVSEIMLQQTQTDRVMKKFSQFLETFPNWNSLAHAQLRNILKTWQGLGYNRRALALKKIAQKVIFEFNGNLPLKKEILITFPGIGAYTAGALLTFIANQQAIFIETNIRTVFIHFFFKKQKSVNDREIIPLIEKTIDRKNPREWYFALMDYGAMLKKHNASLNEKSAHYTKQGRFKGSNREVRGKILKVLISGRNITESDLIQKLQENAEKVRKIVKDLLQEKLVLEKKGKLCIA
jgi:A/G-specific adenine glycosylase